MKTKLKVMPVMGMLCALIISGAADARPAKGGAGRLKFKAGDASRVQETTVMAKVEVPGMESMNQPASASVSVLNIVAEKVFPDGSALVSQATASCKRGATLADLKEAPIPNSGKPGYALRTRDGRIFMVQGKMAVEDPAQQAMMDESGNNNDEVAILRGSKTTEKFLKVMRNQGPIDVIHIPAKAIKAGSKIKMDAYEVTRLQDETIDGVKCEVYKAEMKPMVETNWLDAKVGRIVKHTLVQGDPAQLEISQVLVK